MGRKTIRKCNTEVRKWVLRRAAFEHIVNIVVRFGVPLARWISVKPDDINVCSFSMLPKPE